MPPAEPAFRVERIGDATCVLILNDAVFPSALAEIGAALMQAVAGPGRVIVDMSRVGFMPTTMLGYLIAASTRLREKGSRLAIAGAAGAIAEVFVVAKVKGHFDFHATVEAAVKAGASAK